jgi:Helix-turn-helix domain
LNLHSQILTPIQPAAFKLKDAAKYIGGLNVVTLCRLIERGEIKRQPSLRHVVISKAELDRWLAK